MNILNELFLSKKRQLVDKELKRIADKYISNPQLRDNILYHLCLDKNIVPTLEHSKRLRAYFCLLFAEEGEHNIADIVPLAVTVELLHNSTLIIDDIQDNGNIRCGKPALWKKEDLANALNASYFLGLFAQSYFYLQKQKYKYWDYSHLFVETTNKLISGQQSDIDAHSINNKSLYSYCEIAKGKTGALLNLCCHFGCMPYEYKQEFSYLLTEFTNLFSCAYQIFDDLNDLKYYIASEDISIDSSNIFYFFSDKQISTQTVNETMLDIVMYQQELLSRLNTSIGLLKSKGIIKTEKLQLIINDILKTNVYVQ
jgi:geranylgeranyl pyrophosphate synthase